MAGIKISALPAVGSAQLTDIFPVVQGGVTYKETSTQLATLFGFSGGVLAVTGGGTGVNSINAYNIVAGNAAGTGIATLSAGTAGQLLMSNGAAAFPTWLGTINNGFVTTSNTGAARVSTAAATLTELGTGTSSATMNGYATLPGGIIIQWGVTSLIAVNNSVTVTFPIAFPNTFYTATASAVVSAGSASGQAMSVVGVSLTQFTVTNTGSAGASASACWTAIGN